MATFTIQVEGSVKFNVKAQTADQAIYKACDFLLDYPTLGTTGKITAYTSLCGFPLYDVTLPFITMTSAGYKKRYKVNPNTNKKAIAKLLASV